MTGVLVGVPVHTTVAAALRQAGSEQRQDPVDTRVLLAMLMRLDLSGSWDRFRLRCGDFDTIAAAPMSDAPSTSGYRWEDVPVTDTCAVALDTAARLAHRHRMWPLPVGLVAVALLADPASGAARALGPERAAAIDILQADVLGVTLGGLTATLPAVLAEAQRASLRPTAPPPHPTAGPPRRRGFRFTRVQLLLIAVALLGLVLFVEDRTVGDLAAPRPGDIRVPSVTITFPQITIPPPPSPFTLGIPLFLAGDCVRDTQGVIDETTERAVIEEVPCADPRAQATVLGTSIVSGSACHSRYPATDVVLVLTSGITGPTGEQFLCLDLPR
ncbi:hypothetical protein [Nocardia sp. NPDC057353]|uniref:LppU/SCO3897 family protein n=1 Tax=Nocardia sp. NPDC057353 TaxID=3346104 RepID=UPI003643B831